MPTYRLLDNAKADLADMYTYGRHTFGLAQADAYLDAIFQTFERLSQDPSIWRPIPEDWDIPGHFYRFNVHHLFFRTAENGDLLIYAVMDNRRDIPARLRDVLRKN